MKSATTTSPENAMTEFVPAEAFPAGEFLKDEIDARGWTQEEFARIIGKTPGLVSDLINGKREMAPEIAMRIGAALGTSAQMWLNLDTAYRLYELSRTDPAPTRIAREAALRTQFPVRDLVRRNWVKDSEDYEVLESRVLRFYGIPRIDAPRQISYAARQTDPLPGLTQIQEAWLFRVKQIAEATEAVPYSEKKLRAAITRLSELCSAAEEARHAPRILAECGIRFVVVEPIQRSSRIDGVCFWLAPERPVIGMSLRRDTIDNFWFVLRHEIEHVLRKDGQRTPVVDSGLCDTEHAYEANALLSEAEDAANAAAAEFCVPQAELKNFLARVGTAVSEHRVLLFAERLKVDPGLVIGQIQHKLNRYNFLTRRLSRIRDIVTASALTDGYGRQFLDAVN